MSSRKEKLDTIAQAMRDSFNVTYPEIAVDILAALEKLEANSIQWGKECKSPESKQEISQATKNWMSTLPKVIAQD